MEVDLFFLHLMPPLLFFGGVGELEREIFYSHNPNLNIHHTISGIPETTFVVNVDLGGHLMGSVTVRNGHAYLSVHSRHI